MQSSFMGAGVRSGALRSSSAFTARRPALIVRAGYNNMVKLGGGKKWERQELTPNGKPVKIDMHVKRGDIVQVGGMHSVGGFRGLEGLRGQRDAAGSGSTGGGGV